MCLLLHFFWRLTQHLIILHYNRYTFMNVDNFNNLVSAYISENHLLVRNDAPVLVTLSGGADSVALLRVLVSLGYNCIAAHCNFHLRGDESDRDERFVVDLCQSISATLYVEHMDVPAYQTEHKVSVEMACRELRYAWFAQLANQLGCQAIAVAHHSDDNVETFFLNALRGSGISGLGAIKPRNGNIVRPLLCVSRSQIEEYLQGLGQDFVTDSTNLENEFKRNKVRNIIVPAIEDAFPGAREKLAETVEHTRDYADLYQDLLGHLKCSLVVNENGMDKYSIERILSLKTSKLPLLLFDLFKQYGFSFEQCKTVANVIASGKPSGQHFHTSTYTLSLNCQYIIIEKYNNVDEIEILIDFTNLDNVKDILEVEAISEVPFSPSMCDGKRVVAFSKELLSCSKVVLRHWRSGDRIRPFGMRGVKLLSDLFTDAKLSPEGKKTVWVMEADGKIVWVLGLRAADAFRVTPGSTDFLLLSTK